MENLQQIENDNIQNELTSDTDESQKTSSQDSNLILGKFKSIDDLTAAYKKMESQQGLQSKELGELRKKAQIIDEIQKKYIETEKVANAAREYISGVVNKYNKQEYFQNSDFGNLYKEAFNALGTNLDTDKFISLLDKYVSSRINLHQKAQSAINETEKAKSQMQFSDSPTKSVSKKIPKLDTLDPKEIDEYIAKYI